MAEQVLTRIIAVETGQAPNKIEPLSASVGIATCHILVSQSFSNDILLALSCREFGCVLVTENERDFQRLQRDVEFEFVKPWPGEAS